MSPEKGGLTQAFARLLRADVPLEREFANVPCTIIVRANPANAKLVATCDVFDGAGTRRVLGRSSQAVAVFFYTGSGILVSGLPALTVGAD